MRSWNVNVLLHQHTQRRIRYDRRHFHQRLLRETHTMPARVTGWRWSLGHFDSLLGDVSIELLAHLHQLVLHLRHRNVLSTICSTVRRWSRSCGLTSKSRSGRVPPGSSSYSEKNSVSPATLVVWLRRASYVASALAVVCPRGVWCRASARAIATLLRAYFRYARRRRSLRRRAAPAAWSTRVSPTKAILAKMSHKTRAKATICRAVACVVVVECLNLFFYKYYCYRDWP